MASKNKNTSDNNADNEEQSMEEILQSIRRIIAEEDEGSIEIDPATLKEQTPVEAPEEEDVLELTEEMSEETPAAAEPEPVATANDTIDFDKLFGSEPLLEMETPLEPPVLEEKIIDFEPTPEPESLEGGMDDVGLNEMEMSAMDAEPDTDSLLSDATAAATIDALKAIKSMSAEKHAVEHLQSHVFRSGVTVEDLVIEALRPMLKEWLDGNLPQIVERIVQKEVRKLVQRMDD